MLTSSAFKFSQRFPCSARKLFDWATDYQPGDLELMGHHGSKRKVTRICNDTILLTDTLLGDSGKRVVKKKLVRIYADRLTWTNTHLSGPNVNSQFLYEVVAVERNQSRLDFTGLQIVDTPTTSKSDLAALAKQICAQDSATWKRLAAAYRAANK